MGRSREEQARMEGMADGAAVEACDWLFGKGRVGSSEKASC